MMLLLDFAVAYFNRRGGKKTHGNQTNNKIDQDTSHSITTLHLQTDSCGTSVGFAVISIFNNSNKDTKTLIDTQVHYISLL